MPSLQGLLIAYRANRTLQTESDLLRVATRRAQAAAVRTGHPDPEDLAQRVMLKLWQQMDAIESSVVGWIETATRRLAKDDWRRRAADLATEHLVTEGDDEELPNTLLVEDEQRPCRNIQTIADPRLRKAAAMMIVGHSVQDAADAAGMSTRHLRRTILRSDVQNLRKIPLYS